MRRSDPHCPAIARRTCVAASLLLAAAALGCQGLGRPSAGTAAGHFGPNDGYGAGPPPAGVWAPGAVIPSTGYGPAQAPTAPGPAQTGGADWSAGRQALAPQAIAFARAQLGKPYCWGGTGPGCFDCSGLVYAAWAAAGVRVPRSSDDQAAKLAHVPLALAAPGDIVWREGHVGLYLGDGLAIHAPRTGKTVTTEPASHYQVALRP